MTHVNGASSIHLRTLKGKIKVSNKHDTWGRWRKEAIRDHDRASSEYLHQKSKFEKFADLLEESRQMSRLPWHKRMVIKGCALKSKVDRHVLSILSSSGESAAQLAPDSGEGAIFDFVTSVGPLAALKVLKLSKVGRVAGYAARTQKAKKIINGAKTSKEALSPMKRTTFEALQDLHKAAGYPEIARHAARTHKARKIISGVKAGEKAMHVFHAVHATIKTAPIVYKNVKNILHGKATNHTTQESKPVSRKPFTQHPWSQIGISGIAKSVKPVKPRGLRSRGPNYSFLDPIKIADWKLQSQFKSGRSIIPLDKPFMSTIERLKALEKRSIEKKREASLIKRFKNSISAPQPLDAHKQMQRRYGAKIYAIAKRTPKINQVRPNIKSGYGQFNPLKEMAGPLINQNRTKSMMKPRFR